MSGLRIGEVAREAGVTVETVRYYEDRALIPEPPRSYSGYRQYPATSIGRVRFIQRAKELGFSLKEIHALLTLRHDDQATCAAVKARTERKIAEVEQKIDDLTNIRNALAHLVEQCNAGTAADDCPILDILDKQTDPRQ